MLTLGLGEFRSPRFSQGSSLTPMSLLPPAPTIPTPARLHLACETIPKSPVIKVVGFACQFAFLAALQDPFLSVELES